MFFSKARYWRYGRAVFRVRATETGTALPQANRCDVARIHELQSFFGGRAVTTDVPCRKMRATSLTEHTDTQRAAATAKTLTRVSFMQMCHERATVSLVRARINVVPTDPSLLWNAGDRNPPSNHIYEYSTAQGMKNEPLRSLHPHPRLL